MTTSDSDSPSVNYRCTKDCRETGCPGHALQVAHDRSAGKMTVTVDGLSRHVFSESEFDAILRAEASPVLGAFPGITGFLDAADAVEAMGRRQS